MINLIPQILSIIDGATRAVITTIPPSGTVARAIPGPALPCDPVDGIPVTAYAPPVRVEGLPESGDIIVPAMVTDAMRVLGMHHAGAVYSPAPLVFVDGKPLGAPGLIRHADLSA